MKIAIVGAGMTGLVAGYRLSQQGHEITIFEKSNDIGGLVGGFGIGKTNLEKAYHHIFSTDKYIIDLIEELELTKKLKWHEEKTALYYNQEMYPFMGAVDLLKFKPLGIVSKIRLGLVKIWLQLDNNWQKYEDELAYEWMKKWCGQEAYEVIWEPLLRGKFHNKYKKVSMAWLWARIHTRGNSAKLGYLHGGFYQIADRLAKKILQNKGKIFTNYELRIIPQGGFQKGANYELLKDFDKVLYTGPSKEVEYLGAITLVFTSKQNLSKYYWHNINDKDSPILCFIQHTNLVNKKEYGDKHVYYAGTYIPNEGGLMDKSETEIKKIFFDYLKKIYPDFDKKKIERSWLWKFKNAQHIVSKKYKVESFKVKKNVYQANFAMIYPEDRGTNFAVREGGKVAKELLASDR